MARSYTQNVRKGVRLLDKRRPDWRDKIDVARLDMGYVSRCVLGQLSFSYNGGLEALFGESVYLDAGWTSLDEAAFAHGFDTYYLDDNHARLTELWTEAIVHNTLNGQPI